MSRRKKILSAVLGAAAVAFAFAYGQLDVANDSIRFDLTKIGESIYEAHARSGKWPTRIADLEDTAYLRMPYRRGELEMGVFVVVWQENLDPDPERNASRVLAYHNRGLLAQFGKVWACRGDLRIERMNRDEMPVPNAARLVDASR